MSLPFQAGLTAVAGTYMLPNVLLLNQTGWQITDRINGSKFQVWP